MLLIFATMVLTSQDQRWKIRLFAFSGTVNHPSGKPHWWFEIPILRNGSVAGNQFKPLITMKLYVGNLSFDITERTLRELFEPFGTVSEVKLIMDRETGQSRGFGFVTMGNVSEGNAAIKGLHGKDKGGRKLTVNEARPKDDRGGHASPGSRR
jgi:cold-inducible RNA-binding protein